MTNKILIVIVIAAGAFGAWVLMGNNPFGNETANVSDATKQEEQGGITELTAFVETSKGTIEIELFPTSAPNTVVNFVNLARSGFYDGTTFHRVVPEFVIQGGDPFTKDDDPTNDGRGGPGYTFEDEINPSSIGMPDDIIQAYEEQLGFSYNYDLESYPVDLGYVAMANTGPNTNGSQFFVVLSGEQRHLYGRHTVFGRVVNGLDVALQVEQGDKMTVTVPVSPQEPPFEEEN